MRRRELLFAFITAVVAACGDRTGLLVPSVEMGVGPHDAAPDAFEDSPDDVVEDDSLPPIDVTPPPPDAPNDCPDASSTLIYVITMAGTLFSYDPATNHFSTIGPILCPSTSIPNSMAVDRNGIAYINFFDGHIFRVSTANASCRPTPYMPGPGFPPHLGMAFTADPTTGAETLFLAGDTGQNLGDIAPLATAFINPNSYGLSIVGTFPPRVVSPELTGTAAGDLFAFYRNLSDPSSSAIGQVDKLTGAIVAETPLPGVVQGLGWAFAFWGGDFYTFTASGSGSVVNRFRPSNGSIEAVASLGQTVVGAGVSTCAPQQ
jgi:hypothetical protein